MFRQTLWLSLAVIALQGVVSLFFPVPYGLEGRFFTVSVITSLGGMLAGAALGSWQFFSRRPWGLFVGLAVVVAVTIVAIYLTIELYRLYHLGGVPDNFDVLVTWYYAGACFSLLFMFGFLRLELSFFGVRIKRGR